MDGSAAGETGGPGNGQVDCSVLTPVLNEERQIAQTVAAMLAQRFAGTIEFILVDGASTDATRAILTRMSEQDPRIRVLDNPLRTTPSSLNLALSNARGRWVARMDGHTEYPQDYLERGIERLGRGGTRWVSGPQVPAGGGTISRAVALALRTPLGRGGSRKWAAEAGSDGAEYELDSGVFCGVWDRAALLETGGWDERWVRNQDSEMAGRFLARGERLICVPAMAARYVPRNSLSSLWRQYFEYGMFRARTAARHPHTMRRSHLLAPAVVLVLGAAAAGRGPVQRVARVGTGVYVLALTGAGVWALRSGERRDQALLVPLVLATMHLGHGSGFLAGALRGPPPAAAILRAVGLQRLAERLAPREEPVYAPSLGRPARA